MGTGGVGISWQLEPERGVLHSCVCRRNPLDPLPGVGAARRQSLPGFTLHQALLASARPLTISHPPPCCVPRPALLPPPLPTACPTPHCFPRPAPPYGFPHPSLPRVHEFNDTATGETATVDYRYGDRPAGC